jgi:hypothetical protein
VPLCRLRVPVLLLVCALATGCLDVTEVQFGQLQVLVVDDHGAPVQGAQIEPHGGWYWWHRRAVGFTDGEGRAQFRLPPTTYRVFAHPPEGYHHLEPPHWSTMKEVPVTETGASVVLELLRLP